MASHQGKLHRLQHEAIAALLAQPTHALAAKSCGIAARTLQRWLLVPDFRAAYREAQREAFDTAIAKLEAASSRAVDRLTGDLDTLKASDRIAAARAILDNAFRSREVIANQERLAELERIIAELQK